MANDNKYMLPVGTVLHGTYRIDGYLSSGGFGNTYVVTNIQLGGKRAVKEFFMRGVSQRDGNNTTVSVSNADNEATFNSQLAKFKKEARRLYSLRNGHIVQVYDLFDENGTAYYVMDFIDGMSLSGRMRRTGLPMTEDEVVRRILPQILDALDAAHKAGIYHLDLKPANIMLGKDDVVKLIDFGASKQQKLDGNGATTTTTTIAYTPGYAPIEQIEQELEEFGPWTDFYALGATLYTLLTNSKPPSPTKILRDSSSDKAATLPLPKDLSPKTKRLILWLMAYDSSDRPQSVEEIKDSLTDAQDVTIVDGDPPKESNEHVQTPAKNGHSDDFPVAIIIIIGVAASIIIPFMLAFFANNSNNSAAPIDSNSIEYLSDDTITVNGVSFVMKGVQGGVFTMGATSEQGSYDDEKPKHRVAVSSFRIGQTEVTQRLWQAVMGSNPSYYKGDDRTSGAGQLGRLSDIHQPPELADGSPLPPAHGGGVGICRSWRQQEQRL